MKDLSQQLKDAFITVSSKTEIEPPTAVESLTDTVEPTAKGAPDDRPELNTDGSVADKQPLVIIFPRAEK